MKNIYIIYLLLIVFIQFSGKVCAIEVGNDTIIGSSTISAIDPQIAYCSVEDTFMIVWTNDSVGYNQIYYNLAADGDLNSSGSRLSSAYSGTFRYAEKPQIAYDASTSTVGVVYSESYELGKDSIILSFVNAGTGLKSGDFSVGNSSTWNMSATISSDNNGNFLVAYYDSTSKNISAKIYNNSGVQQGATIIMGSVVSGYLLPYSIDIAYNSDDDKFLVVWADISDKLYSRTVTSGGVLGISLGYGSITAVANPAVAYNNTTNEFFIVYDDYAGNVAGQLTDSVGNLTSAFTFGNVNKEAFPDVGFNNTNSAFVITWQEYVGSAGIWMQEYLSGACTLLTDSVKIDDITSTSHTPAIAYNSEKDNYWVLWFGDESGTDEIFFQKYKTDVNPTEAKCQDITVYLNTQNIHVLQAVEIDGGSTVLCGVPILSVSKDTLTCSELPFVYVDLIVSDNAGNVDTCAAKVTVVDSFPPSAVCQNINIYLNGAGNATIVAADIDGGSTDNCGGVTLSASQTAFNCADLGPNNITLTVTDGNGNTSNCIGVATVIDTISPSITCPGNQTESPNASCNFTLPDYSGLVIASDNCNPSSTVTQSPVPGTVISGTTTILMTADDGNGNTSQCTFNVILNDATAPRAVCQNINVYLDGTGNATIVATDIDGGSTDNCSSVTLGASATAFTCADLGANNVTLTATDGSSNTSDCVAVVTVLDTVSPAAVCQNINVYLDGTGNATVAAMDIDGGSTDNCSSVTLSASATAFTCADLGANNVTLTATDGSSNTSDCVAVVTVIDNTNPTVSCPGNQTENSNASCQFTLPDYTGLATVGDNCNPSPTVTQSPAPGTVISGTTTIMLTADDGNGNSANCTFDVILNDATAPTAVCQNINVFLDGTGNATIVATDIDGGSTDNCGSVTLSASATAFTCADFGVNNVTLTVTDGSLNSANCVAVVTVLDTVSPAAVCQDVTVYLDGAGDASIVASDIDGGSTDNCSSVTLSASATAFTCADIGANNVTLTATDGSSNTSDCVAVVTVLDTVSPAAICQNINVYLDGSGSATIAATDIDGGSTDNCSSVTLSVSVTAFTCANLGANNVTLTVTDGSSNTSDCVAVVTVLDTVSPVAVCQNINVYLDGSGNATITATDIDGGSTDNCSSVSLSFLDTINNVSSFDCGDLGSNNVALTVTDGSSNSANCIAVVTVLDTVLPAAVCQNINVYLDGSGNATIAATDIDGGSTDNCSSVTLNTSATAFTCADIGSNNVTLTATDGSSNTSDCVAVVTVLDTVSPAAVCQNINVYLDGDGNATIAAMDIDGGSTDNCGSVTLSASATAFTCADIGANNVTLTVTDGSSNTSDCVAVVTVLDTVSPAAICQNINVYLDGTGNATIAVTDIDGGSTDNCSSVTLSASATAFTCADLGANNVTLTATDGSSNTSDCVAVVTVLDTVSPAAVCQDVTVYLDGVGDASIVASDIDGGSIDNCSSVTLSASATAFTCADIGANNVTLTVTDGSSNTSDCVAVVTVLDTVSPTAVCQNINIYLDGSGNATITATDIDGGSTDNCGIDTMWLDVYSFTSADIGDNTVVLTVVDNYGNSLTCSAIVTVKDNTPPDVQCNSIEMFLNEAGNYEITNADIAALSAGTTDNVTSTEDLKIKVWPSLYDCEDIGNQNQVVVYATDEAGKTSRCWVYCTVTDTFGVTVEPVENIEVEVDAGVCETTISYPEIISTNKCARFEQTAGLGLNGLFPVGTTVETWEVTNARGDTIEVSFAVTVSATNSTPSLDALPNIVIDEDSVGVSVMLKGISDGADCDPQEVTVTAVGVNSMLVTDIVINYTSPDSTGMLDLTIAPNRSGTDTITVTVADDMGGTVSKIFVLTVNAVNDPPTIDTIADVTVDEDTPTVNVVLTGISSGSTGENQTLTVTAMGENTTLIPTIMVNYVSPDSTGSLDLAITPLTSGTDTIIVTVSDGVDAVTETFVLIVRAINHLPVVVNPVGDKVVNASYVLKIPVEEVFDDADGDTLTYGIIVDGSDIPPAWMEVVGDTILCQPMIADTGCVVVVITGTDPDGAIAADTFEICVDGYPTAIGDIDAGIFAVTMYPNPTRGEVNLRINVTEIMDSEVVVRSINGSEVFRKYYKASEQITINLSEHVSGVYLVTLHIGDKSIIKKLILDRK